MWCRSGIAFCGAIADCLPAMMRGKAAALKSWLVMLEIVLLALLPGCGRRVGELLEENEKLRRQVEDLSVQRDDLEEELGAVKNRLEQIERKSKSPESAEMSTETARAFRRGLTWLSRHQGKNGSWSCRKFSDRCDGEDCSGHAASDE